MLNKVILIGRLGKDPEVRYMPNGEAVRHQQHQPRPLKTSTMTSRSELRSKKMSYLKYIKESLKNIDDLCDGALKENDDYVFYINEIQAFAQSVLSNFESLIYELKLGEEKLIEAARIIEEYLHGKD